MSLNEWVLKWTKKELPQHFLWTNALTVRIKRAPAEMKMHNQLNFQITNLIDEISLKKLSQLDFFFFFFA